MSAEIVERIMQEMSLRDPQADSLLSFAGLIDQVDLRRFDQARVRRLLEHGVRSFPDEYARITFALATGVGKTRLMGAIAAYLFLTGKSQHFVFLAPSSTIYRKMRREAQIGHPKYIFGGLTPFPIPEVICADNVDAYRPEWPRFQKTLFLFILTPGQIRPRSGSEVERRLRRESEILGPSFVDHLAALDDLVVFLDEGHRYGQDAQTVRAWTRAIEDLKPKLVIEMTATPSNPDTVLYRYDLREALREGKYIKNVVAIVEQMQIAVTEEEWDKHTLLEGLKRLEVKKGALAAFRENLPGTRTVKPVLLVACRDTTHAAWAENWLQSDNCFKGRYKGKVLRIDITQSEEEIARLLEVEDPASSIEIIVNVGMLREGWDVNNVYVIVPLRAMVGETLATQTIGRGLRLPYGSRVGNREVDTLDVLCFGRETVQQVIEEAKKVGVQVELREGEAGRMTFRKIAPTKQITINVPAISLVTKPPTLRGWKPVRHVDVDLLKPVKLTGVEVQTGKVEELGEALALDIKDVPKRLAQLLCREVSELGGEESEMAQIFREYLIKAGCDTAEKQQKVLQMYGSQIYQDVLNQVETLIKKAESEYQKEEAEVETFSFTEVIYSVPVSRGVVAKDAVQWPRDKSCLVSRWKRSLYPECTFDTPDELTVARILDDTGGIIWVRNPVQQFGILTQVGWHYPDFVIIKKSGYILLEVKNHDELNDIQSDAYKKGRAATEWCDIASGTGGESWEYWIIPHDLVTECATLTDLKSKRFVFA